MAARLRSLVFVSALLACTCACTGGSQISRDIASQFDASQTEPIDLALVGPPSWERVCVLTPYTNNEQAAQVLGFDWGATEKTIIGVSDWINVLVFVKGNQVVAYTEHPRGKGDLAQLQPRCLPRTHAKLLRQVERNGWVLLVAADSAGS